MKEVIWTDRLGYKHRSLVRNDDDDPETGILLDPPSFDELDWEGIKRDIHNGLVERRIGTWQELQRHGGLRSLIVSVMKRRIIMAFKLGGNT